MLRPQFVRAQVQILPVSIPFFFCRGRGRISFFLSRSRSRSRGSGGVARGGLRRVGETSDGAATPVFSFSRNGTIGAPIQERLGFKSSRRFVVVRFRFEKDLASRTLTLMIEDMRKSYPYPLPAALRQRGRRSVPRTTSSIAHAPLPPSPACARDYNTSSRRLRADANDTGS